MKEYTRDEIIANRILFLLVLGLLTVLFYTETKKPDSQTRSMMVYGIHKGDGDCTFLERDNDIFWTDVYIGCKISVPPSKLHGFTLRYESDFKKHYVGARSNNWCPDITSEYSYTPCEKIFAYRKYFYENL